MRNKNKMSTGVTELLVAKTTEYTQYTSLNLRGMIWRICCSRLNKVFVLYFNSCIQLFNFEDKFNQLGYKDV